jgi:hypothetical protein
LFGETRKNGWAATWQARSDLVKKGYLPKTVALWTGIEPTMIDADAHRHASASTFNPKC